MATDYDHSVRKWYVEVTHNKETRYECFSDRTLTSMQKENWIHPRLRNQNIEKCGPIHMDATTPEDRSPGSPAFGSAGAGSPTGPNSSQSQASFMSSTSADYPDQWWDGIDLDKIPMAKQLSKEADMGKNDRKNAWESGDKVERYDSIGSIQGGQCSLEDGFKKADTNRRLADLEAPHGLFIFAPILMLLMLIYLVLRKPAAKWNSTSSSSKNLSNTTEKPVLRRQ